MTPYILSDAQARTGPESKIKFYPLVNKTGKVVEFPETTAREILSIINVIREEVPQPDYPDSPANKGKLLELAITTRHFIDGWRPLSSSEYTHWDSNGRMPFLNVEKEKAVPQSIVDGKDAEIAELKAKLAALESSKKAKHVDVQPVIPGTEGGKA